MTNFSMANLSCFIQAFLSDDNLGDSLDGVEALIRKHDDFEKSFSAQEEKIKVYQQDFLCQRTCVIIVGFCCCCCCCCCGC